MRMFGGDYRKTSNPGIADTFYTDVYNYNGSSWTNVSTAGREPTQNNAATWDSGANKFITFGGTAVVGGNYVTRNTTWTWSPTTGWANVTPATNPTARRNLAIAYDPIRQRTLLFGGSNGTFFTDTWELNSTTNTWTNKAPATSPAPRYGASLFFNPDAGRIHLFGSSPLADSEDLWSWDGTTWSEIPLIGTLIPTYQRLVGFDQASHSIVVFGGRDTSLSNFVPTSVFALVKNRPNSSVEACTSAQVDYDFDGKSGCVDDECWTVCDPLHPPGTTRPAGAPFCGDASCNGPEDCMLCPGDCGACTGKCGDFNCDSGETAATCSNDC